MNEQYLSRGKDIDTNDWRVGHIDTIINNDGFVSTYIRIPGTESRGFGKLFCVQSDTLGRCTGLQDKNGVLIYEGDVLRVTEANPDLNEKCIVRYGMYKHVNAQSKYSNGDLGFYLEWIDNKWLRNDILYWIRDDYIQKIGNIHDNPELLNRESEK